MGFLLQWKKKFSLDFVEFSRRALYSWEKSDDNDQSEKACRESNV